MVLSGACTHGGAVGKSSKMSAHISLTGALRCGDAARYVVRGRPLGVLCGLAARYIVRGYPLGVWGDAEDEVGRTRFLCAKIIQHSAPSKYFRLKNVNGPNFFLQEGQGEPEAGGMGRRNGGQAAGVVMDLAYRAYHVDTEPFIKSHAMEAEVHPASKEGRFCRHGRQSKRKFAVPPRED